MDLREQRAVVIAAMARIDRQGGAWIVPSQSAEGKKYRVSLDGAGTCDCPDHTESGFCCKHIRAVRIVLKRELGMDGAITETKSITFTEKRVYRQNEPAFYRAQSTEKHRFQAILHDLCSRLPEPEHNGVGRKPHLVKDSVFAMVFKVYSLFSSRRFTCDLKDAHGRGHVSKPIPGIKVCEFFQNEAFTPILKRLIGVSASPLRVVERDFAIDSSGFGTRKFCTWFDEKYGCNRRKSLWIKAHIACGVKTNVVTAVRILDKDAADSPQFAPLVKDTAKTFQIGEVSADKAYSSLENFEAVADCGGTGFIAFKSNTTGGVGGLFEKMFHYFQYRQDEFLSHYHKRSNVESTFSAVKRKFGDAVRSTNDTAMVNEVLCKFLCQNICCLIGCSRSGIMYYAAKRVEARLAA